MLHVFEPATETRFQDLVRRSPAVPVAVAVAVGILLDRFLEMSFLAWWSFSIVAALVTAAAFTAEFRRTATTALLLGCIGLGGSWHHWCWSCTADTDISNWATDRGRLVRLRGKILKAPLVLDAKGVDETPWSVRERTLTVIECRHLIGSSACDTPVTGQVRVSVIGRLEAVSIGDVVEVIGTLFRPTEPSNPGDFDFRRWLRAQGLHATLAIEAPEAVAIVGRDMRFVDAISATRAAIRHRAEDLITSRLSSRNAAVAQSLLLGSRVELDRELRQAFAESGLLHVLAISGMNVGLLWTLLLIVCRAVRCPQRLSLVAALLLLPAYAAVTDANPPVVRATIAAVVLAFGQLVVRAPSHWNSLALAALLVLASNPSDLFNAGAQLSFVAVCAILLTSGLLQSFRVAIELPDGPASGGILRSAVNWLTRKIVEACVISLVVWVMTSPLIASQFHLVSPIGSVLTVVLGPLIVVMFWLGYSFLLLGMVSSTLFGWLGTLFDLLLGWFLWAVQMAAQVELGHNYVPAPPMWWVAGFYCLLLVTVIIDQCRRRIFWSPRVVLAWSVLGLAVTLRPEQKSELTCTVFSVSHGLSVLVECPNGRTLLYDAGSMSGGSRAARTIESAVWSTGKTGIDAIVVSHADADHCNAIPELSGVIAVRSLFLHRTFLDWSQPAVANAVERSSAAGTSIQLLSAGQKIELDPSVTMRILHPEHGFTGATDNANSVVLCLEYAGRRIVLTGDLEREGLYRLLMSDRLDTDVLLAPHHGSLPANPTDLARWASPEWLIASCRDDAVRTRLSKNFGPETQILTTARHGAIQCRIQADGELHVASFKRQGN